METYDHVSVAKKANISYGGNVASRIVIFPNGDKKTLGIMCPGEYEFSAKVNENIDIYAGEVMVQLPHDVNWHTVMPGESFEVPALNAYKMKVIKTIDFCCTYIRNDRTASFKM